MILHRFPNGNRTVGNAFFRRAVADRLEDYKQHQQAKNRHGMASVVKAIADEVHKSGGRFIDQNWRGTVRRISVYVQTYMCMLHRKHTSYSCHCSIASFGLL
jgi:hypothetical protein